MRRGSAKVSWTRTPSGRKTTGGADLSRHRDTQLGVVSAAPAHRPSDRAPEIPEVKTKNPGGKPGCRITFVSAWCYLAEHKRSPDSVPRLGTGLGQQQVVRRVERFTWLLRSRSEC